MRWIIKIVPYLVAENNSNMDEILVVVDSLSMFLHVVLNSGVTYVSATTVFMLETKPVRPKERMPAQPM